MCVNLTRLRNFIPACQLAVMRQCASGEEGAYFRAKLAELDQRFKTMPQIYQQDGKGQDAIAYLHYFHGGNDWYITERDFSEEQVQAFGCAALSGNSPELGYISVAELIAHGVELDLHFEPTALRTVRKN